MNPVLALIRWKITYPVESAFPTAKNWLITQGPLVSASASGDVKAMHMAFDPQNEVKS